MNETLLEVPRRALGGMIALLGLGFGLGCADLEISHQEVIDFERYPSVSVQVQSAGASFSDTNYLIRELQRHSAFETVVSASEPASTALDVRMWITVRQDSDDDSPTWEADVDYELFSATGLLLQGSESATSSYRSGAREQALDRIVVRFLPAYRY